MKKISDIETENFIDELFRPLIYKYVNWIDILSMNNKDKIELEISEGKWDDGTYILERNYATLLFYRKGFKNKIVISNSEGVYELFDKKNKVETGIVFSPRKYIRFFCS